MNKPLVAAVLALPLYASLGATALAQQPAPAGPPAKVGGPGAAVQLGGPQPGGADAFLAILEYPSNQQSGVDADRFIGYPDRAAPVVFNGMRMRSMLRAGDPYHAGPVGDVLEYRDNLTVVTLEPHAESAAGDYPGVYFYYVQGGVGRVDTGAGTKGYDLRNGVGVLVAPGVKQHFVNTGDAPLSMIMLTWKNNDGGKVKQDIKVVDTNTEPLQPRVFHWVMAGKDMFDRNDGVNLTAAAIRIPAGAYSGPHAHGRGTEEIWVKTGFDVGYAILGSDIREFDGPGAFLAPPNGLTTHSSMNLNKDHEAVWLYLTRRPPPGQGGGTSPRPPAVSSTPTAPR